MEREQVCFSSSVGHKPSSEKWTFDESVADCFDDMLTRSIPQYAVMRRVVFDVGRLFVTPNTSIVDLGCSKGDSLDPFVRTFGRSNRYVGVEVSQPMLMAARERFRSEIEAGQVEVSSMDLRTTFPEERASLVMSVLTLQFVPVNYRQTIIQRVYDSLVPGGAFLVVEKILGVDGPVNDMMVDLYHGLKHEHGYSDEDITRKALSLEGVLVPMAARWNEDMLREAGFRSVDCIWRWMNFAAWIAVKPRV